MSLRLACPQKLTLLLTKPEVFDDHLSRTLGVRLIPLTYVVRDEVEVPGDLPARMEQMPHSTDSSVVEDLVNFASHKHPMFKDDNAQLYYLLEKATRGTVYASSLKTYQKTKNGRGALLSIRNQYAGIDKWDVELEKQVESISKTEWTGQSNYSLEQFVAMHRNAYEAIQLCAQHVPHQIPDGYTRVKQFLSKVKTSDHGLQAAIAAVKTDKDVNGMLYDFEKMVTYILPFDPVTHKRASGSKRNHEASVSTTEGGEVSSGFGAKQGIGMTGVHLHWYKRAEFAKLSDEQRKELEEWRASTNQGKGKGKGAKNDNKDAKRKPKKYDKGNNISAIVKREMAKQLEKQTTAEKELDAMIMALQTKDGPASKKAKTEGDSMLNVEASALKSILRRVTFKNGEKE